MSFEGKIVGVYEHMSIIHKIMNTVRSHLTYIENSIKYLDDAIDSMVTPYEPLITLMCTILGIDRNSAITVIFELGNDVSLFTSSKRPCSWAGLTLGSNESVSKKKSVRISRTGVYLKPALVEIAHYAVKSTKNPCYKVYLLWRFFFIYCF